MANREYLPALRGRFGDWAFYSVLMTFRQVVDRVRYATEIHPVPGSKKLSALIQRELKEGRSSEIATYLRSNSDRFFNSLVIAVYAGDPAWHAFDVKPKTLDVREEDLSDTALYSVGYLSFSGEEELYALDGQHRVAGIRQALKLDKSLAEEEVSVLVVAHHNDEAGLRRTRKLFTTLNRTAKPVQKSEIIALDESDVMAISTRYLVESHPYFSGNQVDVLKKQANLYQNNTTSFTTIINLYDTLHIVFSRIKDKLSHEERERLRYVRPSDEKVDEYNRFAASYYETLANAFPDLLEYFQSKKPEEVLKKNRSNSNSHILFRPIGLKIFAEVVAELREKHSFSEAVNLVKLLPTKMQQPPYADVIWNRHTKTIVNKRAPLCRDLLLYMLGFYSNKEILHQRYAEAQEKDLKDVKLPKVISS
ncbi:MAG: DGQHR domain-containing protein [Roseomonas sp.]|nr:DGQHR domain-containing protein [Roseomonas sp.]